MSRLPIKPAHLLMTAAVALVASFAFAAWSPALAEPAKQLKTPDNFPYKIENGRRVPKANRIAAADGSWREEVRDGPCVTQKEKTASGEYREIRKCD